MFDPLRAWFHTFTATAGWLALHLLVAVPLGAALAAASRSLSRRRRAVRARAARSLCRAAPWLVGLAILLAVLQWIGGFRIVSSTAALTLFGAPATAGSYLMVLAGRSESRGRRRQARQEARFAGIALFAGAVVLAAAGATVGPWAIDGIGRAPAVRFAGIGLPIAAGIAGLLGGLSGKPRPSGHLAALLHVGGVALWIHEIAAG